MRRALLILAPLLCGGCSLLTLRAQPGGPSPKPTTGDPWTDYGVQAASDLLIIAAVVGHRYFFHKKRDS